MSSNCSKTDPIGVVRKLKRKSTKFISASAHNIFFDLLTVTSRFIIVLIVVAS